MLAAPDGAHAATPASNALGSGLCSRHEMLLPRGSGTKAWQDAKTTSNREAIGAGAWRHARTLTRCAWRHWERALRLDDKASTRRSGARASQAETLNRIERFQLKTVPDGTGQGIGFQLKTVEVKRSPQVKNLCCCIQGRIGSGYAQMP